MNEQRNKLCCGKERETCNFESLGEALLLRGGLVVLEISLGGVGKTPIRVGGFDCAIGLVQDLFRLLDEGFDLLYEFCFVDCLVVFLLSLCELNMLEERIPSERGVSVIQWRLE